LGIGDCEASNDAASNPQSKYGAGEFSTDDCISLCDMGGIEFARGLSNYGAAEARQIMGRPNEDHDRLLGYPGSEYLLHRDNISILPSR
jgi:glutamate 5-kinase